MSGKDQAVPKGKNEEENDKEQPADEEKKDSWDGGTNLESSIANLPEKHKVYGATSLTYWYAALFAAVLEDTLVSLRIMSEINVSSKLSEVRIELPTLIAQKHRVAQCEKKELEGVTLRTVNDIQYKYKKIGNDRRIINKILLDTYKELAEYYTFRHLQVAGKVVGDADPAKLSVLKSKHLKYKALCRDQNKQLQILKMQHRERQRNVDKDINEMITTIHDTDVIANVKLRYVKGWQQSRAEQLGTAIVNGQQSNANKIENYKLKYNHEQRIHSETEILITVLIDDLRTQIDHCIKKYDTDMEEIDLKIQIQKSKYNDIVEKRISLEKTLQKHEEEINSWRKFKEERTKVIMYKEKMQRSAIIVQAWWRGFICRQGLGPFKSKKKKGGSGK